MSSSNNMLKYAKVAFSALFVLCLILFNRNQNPLKSKEAREFEKWLAETEDMLLTEEESFSSSLSTLAPEEETTEAQNLATPKVKVTALFYDGTSRSFFVGQESDAKEALRILQLIRETDVFSAEQASEPGKNDPLLTMEVSDDNNQFLRSVRYSTIAGQSSTGVLLKLLEIYSSGRGT